MVCHIFFFTIKLVVVVDLLLPQLAACISQWVSRLSESNHEQLLDALIDVAGNFYFLFLST